MDERTVRGLRLGETVFLSGEIVTARDAAHVRALSAADGPKELNGATLFHCGPIMTIEKEGRKVIAAGPTTSARMNGTAADMIRRYGIRAVIGKGGMSSTVLDAMRETGCVYLAAVGGTAVSLAERIINVNGVLWPDLGPAEAAWILEAENFGPLTVAMDAAGNSMYDNVKRTVDRTRPYS